MKRILLTLHLFLLLQVYFAQSEQKNQPIYKTKVLTMQGQKMEGVLLFAGDSTLKIISLRQAKEAGILNKDAPTTVWVKDIREMRIRDYGATKRGALLGAVAGFVTGAIVGFATYDPCDSAILYPFTMDCSSSVLSETGTAVGLGLLGSLLGASVGVAVGSTTQKITIHGNQAQYMQQKGMIDHFVLKQE